MPWWLSWSILLALGAAAYPKTLAFVERVKAHPVVAARLEAEAKLMGGR